jgi:hypothetical protein
MGVDESEWQTSTDPQRMLYFLQEAGKLSERKSRLFSVACCRRLWSYLEEQSRWAVRAIEQFAEGQATERKRAKAKSKAQAVWDRLAVTFANDGPGSLEAFAAAAVLALTASTEEEATWLRYGQFIAQQVAAGVLIAEWRTLDEMEAEKARLRREDKPGLALCDLLRDLFGNPFRATSAVAPCVLTWNNGCVGNLATAVYEAMSLPCGTLAPDRLAVLADALEEAGCIDDTLLDHLRSPGSHVRGCYAVDLCLGKS